jgi:2,5-diketo-D-gluconate reductase B
MPPEQQTEFHQPVVRLPGDVAMPALGLGTFELEPDVARQAVLTALEVGYRHVDTADIYENHKGVGRALRESGLPREDVFLVTKVWHDRLGRRDVLADADRFLDELGTEYVDQLLIHWPNSGIPMEETLAAMDALVQGGKARTIGVSNFTVGHLEKALATSPQPIAVNQVEIHPYLAQPELRRYCGEKNVTVVAYRPVVKGKVNEDPVLSEIGRKHGRTAAQVTLRWMLQSGMVAIPRSKSREHIEENYGALQFELEEEDLRRIDALDRGDRQIDPAFAEFDGPR